MADFNGVLTQLYSSVTEVGRYKSILKQSRTRITTDRASGSSGSSLEIMPGGTHEFLVFCQPGSHQITCRVYPKDGAGIGSVFLEIVDFADPMTPIDSDSSVGTDAWETLAVSFVATKHCYLGRIVNRTVPSGDARAWIDDLVIN